MESFDLQGHRGARGLKPENTLSSFEFAIDLGVTTIETDVHLTRDGVPILFHDAMVTEQLCRRLPKSDAPDPASRPLVSMLTLSQLRGYQADRNPDLRRFPSQTAESTPLASLYAKRHGFEPFFMPTLADFFAFIGLYEGQCGMQAGKSEEQRATAKRLRCDLELKRVPFYPQVIGDNFDAESPALLEQRVVDEVRLAGMISRTIVRSSDHRSVRAARRLEPGLIAAVLITETAPASPAQLAQHAEAQVYCPDFRFLDHAQVRLAHQEQIRVVPWTVNEPEHWARLLDWGVDGITTDYPDRLASFLRDRGIGF
jgi:glycerophosphoryl diester phosphodiesterase